MLQFDTAFMYVIALLCLVKLYQKRHPDVASSAYKVFLGVGAVLLMEVLGIFTGNTAYWVIAVILYSITMLVMSVVLYHNGKWPLNAGFVFGLTFIKHKRSLKVNCATSISFENQVSGWSRTRVGN